MAAAGGPSETFVMNTDTTARDVDLDVASVGAVSKTVPPTLPPAQLQELSLATLKEFNRRTKV
jgi:hypothetical protein